MIRYKLLAVAFSIFMVLAEEFSILKAETPQQNSDTKTTVFYIPTPENTPEPVPIPKQLTVTATVYHPVPGQTDGSPFTTADGSEINKKNPRKHRWIAVSRDLHSRWGGDINFGDSLVVSGISDELDGLYIVRDTMHRRMKNRIDILVGPKDDIMGYWEDVVVTIP